MASSKRSRFGGARGEVIRSPLPALAFAITTAACAEVSLEKGGTAAGGGGTGGGDAGAPVMPEEVLGSGSFMMLRESSTGVFFYSTGAAATGLVRVDKETGDKSFLTDVFSDDMAVTESDVYFVRTEWVCLECPAEPGLIQRVSAGGGAVTTLATVEGMKPKRVAVGGDSVFFTAAWPGSLHRIPTTGGAPEVIVPSGVNPYQLAVDPPFVLFVNKDNNTILAFDWSTNNAAPIATPNKSPFSLKARGGYVYWETGSTLRTISRMKLGGEAVEDIAVDVAAKGYFDPADGVYFTEVGLAENNSYSNGRLVRADLDGQGQTTLAQGLNEPTEIVAGGAHVYWIESEGIANSWLMRLPKN